MLFLKDSLELHSLKAGNLEVLTYFCCVQKDFVSFYLHGGLIRVYWTDQQETVYKLQINQIFFESCV